MAGRMVTQEVYILIPENCEYVSICDKKNFADVLEATDLKIGRLY